MALKETIKNLKDLIGQIGHDIEKADGGNKAASQRVRTATVRLEKTAKTYRKESIKNEKSSKGTKRPSAKPALKKAKGKATSAKPNKKAPAKAKTLKAKPKAKAHKANARPLSFKKPSAKLLTRRAFH